MRSVEVRRVIKVSKLHERAYCQECGKLVDYSIRDEVVEENFHGTIVHFPFKIGRCKECGTEVATDNGYNFRRGDAAWEAYKKLKGEFIR